MAYTAPTPATLKTRYPAFNAIEDATVQYWLTDSLRTVTDSWIEADRAVAMMALAAHNMAMQGLGAAAAGVPAGVTSFRSGSFSVQVSDGAAERASAGGYDATRYGQEFRRLRWRSKGGPRLVGCA